MTEPLLDKMISGHPIIIQIKPLLNEAKRVAAVEGCRENRSTPNGPQTPTAQ